MASTRRPSTTGESAKHLLETFDDLFLDLEECYVCAELAREARHPVLLDAAGCDPVEPRKVGLHVEGEAVRGDTTGRELHPDGGDLLLPHPHPRVGRMPACPETVVREDEDEKLLQIPQVLVGVERFEAQDRVPDELPRPVKGGVPAPVAPEYLRPQRLEVLLSRPEVRGVPGRATDGIDRGVLQENERVRDLIPLAKLD